MTPFHVGMKVVCVDTTRWNHSFHPHHPRLPEKGEVLTVRVVDEWMGMIGLRFEEIVCDSHHVFGEYGFQADCFRPVVKTDISIFTSMLTNPPLKVDALT